MQDHPVNPGDILGGKYRVDHILGKGAMGVVVAATHLALQQRVALKFMLECTVAGSVQQERFLREARIAATLKSAHVARVLDLGMLESGAPYIVMEFLEGRDLAALLKERRPLPVAEAVELVLQICEAIGEAHAAGIVHRDIKPANLFVTTDAAGMPCCKVLDFGIAKLSDAGSTLTQQGQAVGSIPYMSPEQLKGERDIDARGDIWAIGVTLYEALAGCRPFKGQTLVNIFGAILTEEPDPIARDDVPAGLGAVVLQCLEKDCSRRFASVANLVAALAPYAPRRAAIYVDRVAGVLRVPSEPSLPTDVLPVAPPVPLASLASFAVPAMSMPSAAGAVVQPVLAGTALAHAAAPRQGWTGVAAIVAALAVVAVTATLVVLTRARAARPAPEAQAISGEARPKPPALSISPDPSAAPATPSGSAVAVPTASVTVSPTSATALPVRPKLSHPAVPQPAPVDYDKR